LIDSINQLVVAVRNSIRNKQPWPHWTTSNCLSDSLIRNLHEEFGITKWPLHGESTEHPGSFETTWSSNKEDTYTNGDDCYKGHRLYFRKGIETNPVAKELIDIVTNKAVVDTFREVTHKPLNNLFAKICYVTERTGWKMHIHDDHPESCRLTMIVYLPQDDVSDGNTMGTSLYNQDLTLHHRATYDYNLGEFFIPCKKKFRRTLHGFDGDIPSTRNFLLFQYLSYDDIDMSNPQIPNHYDGVFDKPQLTYHYDTLENLWRVDE